MKEETNLTKCGNEGSLYLSCKALNAAVTIYMQSSFQKIISERDYNQLLIRM